MILFICWVVFVLVLIGSVVVAAMLEKRGRENSAIGDAPLDASYENADAIEGEEAVEELESVEEFSEFPAEGGEQVDDFAAFDQEFK